MLPGLRKCGSQVEQQCDQDQGAADQQEDFGRHVGIHQIFPMHARLPFPGVGSGVAPCVPLRPLNRGPRSVGDPPQEGRPSGLAGSCPYETSIGSLIFSGDTVQNGSYRAPAPDMACCQ